MRPEAVFVRDGTRFTATTLGAGPWDSGALHGGAPAALVMRALAEAVGDPALRVARVTYEFLRPVPVARELSLSLAQVRAGRRTALYDVSLHDPDGLEVLRARGLMLRPSELGPGGPHAPPFAGPEHGRTDELPASGRPAFATAAVEIRFVEGAFLELGPSTAWFRLRVPIVAGEPVLALERLAAAADFGNGIASELSWEEHVFINAELTVYVEREPVGEWVALRARTGLVAGGVPVAEGVLYDRLGRVGRSLQALLVSRR